MGRNRPVLKFLVLFALGLGLVVVGFVAGREYADVTASKGDGRMIYGPVSDVRPATNVVCIKDTCAPLFRGDLPPRGVQVRGRLIELPYDVDNADPDLIWAFVTVLGSG